MTKQPPFTITPKILRLSQAIAHELGSLSHTNLTRPSIQLRRENKIKTIQATLAIEGNSLALSAVTALIEGKAVVGTLNDIQEVKNAIALYTDLAKWNALSSRSFLKAHRVLMQDLTEFNGQWRQIGVGVFQRKKVKHLAPPASRVPLLMQDLFAFIKKNKDLPWIIKACVFHYELEFIHPFIDGNGRMGRLWQQLLCMKEDPLFEFISVEELIKNKQTEYYKTLGKCDQLGDSSLFIEFSLKLILKALQVYSIKNKTSRSRL